MTVAELIEKLKGMPQDFDVRIWDEHENDYVPVVMALWEDGVSAIDLLPREVETEPASDEGDASEAEVSP